MVRISFTTNERGDLKFVGFKERGVDRGPHNQTLRLNFAASRLSKPGGERVPHGKPGRDGEREWTPYRILGTS